MKDFPVIKLSIAFVTGILLLPLVKINPFFIIIVTVVTAILFFYLKGKKKLSKYRIIFSLLSLFIITGIGNIIVGMNCNHFNQTVSKLYKEKNVVVDGEITNIELIREKEIIFYVEAGIFSYRYGTIIDDIKLLCKLRVNRAGLLNFYEDVKPGNRIEIKGTYTKGRDRRNPGEFDYDKYLKSKGITGILTINRDSDYHIIDNAVNVFKNTIFQARKYIDQKIGKMHRKETSALLRGLLLADRREIDSETKTQFINSGVVHVLAVSGLHVGFIAFIFYFLFGRLNIYARSLMTIAGLLCFMFITGMPPSVFRATVMAIVIIIAFITNRSTNIFNSLAIATLIILTLNPDEIYSPGFQLSFAAVIAIGAIYPPLSVIINNLRIHNKFIKYLLLFLMVSLAAQIGTVPFVLIYFGKISIVGLLVNLIVIPAIGIIIALAVTTITLSVILPFIAIYYAAVNDFITEILLNIIAYFGNLSFSKIDIVNYSGYDAIIFYLSVIVLFVSLRRFHHIKAKLLLVILITVNLLLFTSLDDKSILPENKLSVLMIDVGQGDSFLIKFPNGEAALIDAGKASLNFDNGEKVILPLLNYLGVEKINYGFVSHIDLDHFGGYLSLIEANKIETIYKPSLDTILSKDVRFENYLKKYKVEIRNYNMQSVEVGNCRIYILSDDKLTKKLGLNSNDRSGILKIVYGDNSFLFTGDAGKQVEKILIGKFSSFLDIDVLKAGHHGSKTSTSNTFVDYTSPEYAFISAGIQNSFGHPSPEIISMFAEKKIKY